MDQFCRDAAADVWHQLSIASSHAVFGKNQCFFAPSLHRSVANGGLGNRGAFDAAHAHPRPNDHALDDGPVAASVRSGNCFLLLDIAQGIRGGGEIGRHFQSRPALPKNARTAGNFPRVQSLSFKNP